MTDKKAKVKPEKKSEKAKAKPKKKTKKENVEKTEEKEKPSKFKFECQKCGACCQNRDPIPVTFSDLTRWTKQGSFMSIILPHLELRGVSKEDSLGQLALIPYVKMKDEDENGKGICPFYDEENKICNIYFTLPLFCKTFPLYFSGEKYYVSDPTCPGIGEGDMTKEKLQVMRNTSVQDFNERADTTIALIPLQGLFIRHFMKQSQETVDKMSAEDKDKLDELLKKSQDETPQDPDAKDK
ncbi:MAG: YkgJ family cysteine cluster protein [Candidatus Heimdallarchaeota archaeon]|nr:YkgJ family cysteine cluster protein [Candidatus Heimdallarchaeota archaeon]MCG3253619.1 YkgJ family cysteine cluster protein [Candidatus Heimdallarchaeota archaeon]MCK4290755.1 YkgJ family cysteine cluster protein [Candidatus Heimdallarchaeota archaeon]